MGARADAVSDKMKQLGFAILGQGIFPPFLANGGIGKSDSRGFTYAAISLGTAASIIQFSQQRFMQIIFLSVAHSGALFFKRAQSIKITSLCQ